MGENTQTHDFANYTRIYIGKNPSLDTIFCLAILRATVEGFKNLPVTYTDKEKTSFADDELMIGGSNPPLNEYSLEGKQLNVIETCLTLLGLSTDKMYDQLKRYKKASRSGSPFDVVTMLRYGFNYASIEESLVHLDFMWRSYLAHQIAFFDQDINRAKVYEYRGARYNREISTVVSADTETVGALRHAGRTFVVVYNPDTHVVIVQGKRDAGQQVTPGVLATLQRLTNLFLEEDTDANVMVYRWTYQENKPQLRGDLKAEATVDDVETFLMRIAQRLQVVDVEVLHEVNDDVVETATVRIASGKRRASRGFEFDTTSDSDDSESVLGEDMGKSLLAGLVLGKLTQKNSPKSPSFAIPEPDEKMNADLAAAQAVIDAMQQ